MKKIAAVLLILTLLMPTPSYAENIVIKQGTEVLLRVMEKLKSGVVKKGQIIQFLVEKAVKDKEGNILIEDDAYAYGVITESKKAGMFGTSGKLGLQLDKVEAFNGVDVPLRGENENEGTDSTGAVVAGALLVTPLSVLFRGENAVIPAGTILRAYVAKTVVLSGDVEEEKKPLAGFKGNSDVDKKFNELLKELEEKDKED